MSEIDREALHDWLDQRELEHDGPTPSDLADLDGCPTCHGITAHEIGCPEMDRPR